MNGQRAWRRTMLAGAAVTAVVLVVVTVAVHDAKRRVLRALGPRATVGSITLSYPAVTLRDVRIAADPAPGAWPDAEEFHAARVRVRVGIASLWATRHGAPLAVDDVRVEDGLLVMLRTRDKLTLLPALREAARAHAADSPTASIATPASDAAPSLIVRAVHVDRMAVALYDATKPDGPAHPARFERVQGEVDDIALPALAQPMRLDLAGALVGPAGDGSVAIRGSLTPARHDADLAFRLADVDLVALQPWLARVGERPIERGRMDLTLDAHVVDRRVTAPGHLVLRGLAFGRDDGHHGAFAGLERRALLSALSQDDRIDLKFTLEGRTDDPRFSLDDKLGARIVGALGDAVASGAKGAVQGVGGLFKGLASGAKVAAASH